MLSFSIRLDGGQLRKHGQTKCSKVDEEGEFVFLGI